MLPYGIIIKQNRLVLQQSLTVWQKKYGLLRPEKFVFSAIPFVSVFAIVYAIVNVVFETSFSPFTFFIGLFMNMGLVALLIYLTSLRTVREYALSTKEENVQLVLTEDALEITTEFSKEVVPYGEIDLCYEKNFLLTVITDKNAFPLSVSKMHFVKGNYDIFVSLLKSKIPDRYEKRGEN